MVVKRDVPSPRTAQFLHEGQSAKPVPDEESVVHCMNAFWDFYNIQQSLPEDSVFVYTDGSRSRAGFPDVVVSFNKNYAKLRNFAWDSHQQLR